MQSKLYVRIFYLYRLFCVAVATVSTALAATAAAALAATVHGKVQ